MLYLFNSAGAKGYVTNVLNTLHLPKGAQNEYQYSMNRNNNFEKNSYVQIELVEKCINKSERKKVIDSDVLIIFVDKTNPQYRYIPIRRATLKSIDIQDDRIYFKVQLQEYCHVDSIQEFNQKLRKHFEKLLFSLPDYNSTKETEIIKQHQGYLAFEGDKIELNLESDDNSWKQTVCCLSELDVFKRNNCIFTKINIYDKKQEKIINIFNNGKYILKNNKEYEVRTSYYSNLNNAIVSAIKIVCGDSLKCIGETAKDIQLSQSIISYTIVANKRTNMESISFSVDRSEEIITIANKPILCSIRLSWWKWALIALLIAIAAVTMDSITKNDEGSIEWTFSLLSSVVKAVSVFAIWLAGALYSRKN